MFQRNRPILCFATTLAISLSVGAPASPSEDGVSPADLPGLALWLDGADGSTLFVDLERTQAVAEHRQSVAVWADKSGRGHHAAQTNEDRRPAFSEGASGDRSAVLFNGADQYLDVDSFASTFEKESWTVFVVGRPLTASDQGTALAATVLPRAYGRGFAYTRGCRPKRCVGFISKSRNRDGIDTEWPSSGRWEVWEYQNDDGALTLHVDGVRRGDGVITEGALSEFSRAAVGGWPRDGSANQVWEGFLGEIVFFDEAIDAEQSSALRKALAAKWGVALD